MGGNVDRKLQRGPVFGAFLGSLKSGWVVEEASCLGYIRFGPTVQEVQCERVDKTGGAGGTCG